MHLPPRGRKAVWQEFAVLAEQRDTLFVPTGDRWSAHLNLPIDERLGLDLGEATVLSDRW